MMILHLINLELKFKRRKRQAITRVFIVNFSEFLIGEIDQNHQFYDIAVCSVLMVNFIRTKLDPENDLM